MKIYRNKETAGLTLYSFTGYEVNFTKHMQHIVTRVACDIVHQ